MCTFFRGIFVLLLRRRRCVFKSDIGHADDPNFEPGSSRSLCSNDGHLAAAWDHIFVSRYIGIENGTNQGQIPDSYPSCVQVRNASGYCGWRLRDCCRCSANCTHDATCQTSVVVLLLRSAVLSINLVDRGSFENVSCEYLQFDCRYQQGIYSSSQCAIHVAALAEHLWVMGGWGYKQRRFGASYPRPRSRGRFQRWLSR